MNEYNLKNEIEFHFEKLRLLIADEKFEEAIIHYYKILMNKFYNIINEDKAKKFALSSLNSFKKAATDDEFNAVLSFSIKEQYITFDDWNEYQAKRNKEVKTRECEENTFFNLLEG